MAMVAGEVFSIDLLPLVITNLHRLEFEVRSL